MTGQILYVDGGWTCTAWLPERKAMKVEDIKRISVFGAGTMGPGLALVFALGGLEVKLYSRTVETLSKAMETVRSSLDTLVAHGSITGEEASAAYCRIGQTQNMSAAAGEAQLIMETIAETKEAKQALYAEVDKYCSKTTIFASNTSSLDIFGLIPERRRKNAVIAHFFAPAHVIPLVEVVPGPETAPERVETIAALFQRLGKRPVVMNKFGPGFIVDRIERAINETAMNMIEEGLVDAQGIDAAIKNTLGIRLPVLGVMQAFDYQSTSDAQIVAKRDELYLKMLDYLTDIGAFEPV